MRGKPLIAVTGSSNIQAATDLDAAEHLGLTIVPAKDMPEAFRMRASDGGDAMIGSDVLIRTLVAGSSHPEDYRTLEGAGSARLRTASWSAAETRLSRWQRTAPCAT